MKRTLAASLVALTAFPFACGGGETPSDRLPSKAGDSGFAGSDVNSGGSRTVVDASASGTGGQETGDPVTSKTGGPAADASGDAANSEDAIEDALVSASTPVVVAGCPSKPSQPMAPNGYYVNQNTICSFKGEPHLFHGLNRPSLEWSTAGQHISADDFKKMAAWNANIVRIPLNQDYWIAESPQAAPKYQQTVDDVIRWAEEAGLDVILDLHWSDRGVLGSCDNIDGIGCQQLMADRNSVTFWKQVADKYKGDGRVLFDLYNEPKGIPWSTWAHGGTTADWEVVGMQELYDTIRAQGADNIVVIGGLMWAYDLSGILDNPIEGYNIVYATHPYNNSEERKSVNWPKYWGFAAAKHAVMVGEFGDISGKCSPQFNEELIRYADERHVSWLAWAWWVGSCSSPVMITDWSGTPSTQGVVVRDALLGYDDPAAAGLRDPSP